MQQKAKECEYGPYEPVTLACTTFFQTSVGQSIGKCFALPFFFSQGESIVAVDQLQMSSVAGSLLDTGPSSSFVMWLQDERA